MNIRTYGNNIPDINWYDHIIVYFSGGKDSTACVLHLLELGADPEKIELWHHSIDGAEGGYFMDWPCTGTYCRAFANLVNLPIYWSWRQGGFYRELWREDEPTAPIYFEERNEKEDLFPIRNKTKLRKVGGNGSVGTRKKFPQVSADLNTRWCTAYLKIDVAAAAVRNQERFKGKKILTVSGERAEESPNRKRYKEFEPDRTDLRRSTRRFRHVDRWRPIKMWKEQKVWDIIRGNTIMPHPAYRLGWARLSCMMCIFGSADMWATIYHYAPQIVRNMAQEEEKTGLTINRKYSIFEQVKRGKVFKIDVNDPQRLWEEAMYPIYSGEVTTFHVDAWELPAGAFGENAGPI